MTMNLKGRNFLTLRDYSQEEIRYLLDLAKQLKKDKKEGTIQKHLNGKNVVLIFDKTSTRTRCSFEVACFDEGAHVTFLNNSQFGKKESIEDTAKVLGRMYDGIEYRGFEQKTVELLAKHSGIPVWNGLTDVDHPTQTLADFLTIEEHLKKPLDQIKFVFSGDIRNNVCYGLMYGAVKMGMHFVCMGPEELKIDEEVWAYCQQEAKKSGAILEVCHDVQEAVKDADVIYTDIWVSMGEDESLYKPRVQMLSPYKVTQKMMEMTKNPDCLFMHCLPSFHDFETKVAKEKMETLGVDIREVEDEVFRSKNSVVFDEAEKRMHTIKAVMVATIGD
ncbi:MAG: ornithine carbamoyltransferase [Floccifex sp.]